MIDNVIHGPAEGHQHAGVTDVASYLEVHSRAMIKKEQNVFEVTDPIDAYINHGRWVVNCECNGGGLTSPTFKVSCCFDCGRRYTNVVFPNDAKEIEKELMKRREQHHRNRMGESLKVLTRETLRV